MRQIWTFGDPRTTAGCVYCGSRTDTREHVPSRVFLDEPYPENLPFVRACNECNNGFSQDEVYLACLVECTLVGSTSPDAMRREKIRRIMTDTPALAARIAAARTETDGVIRFAPEEERVRRVLLKLARGHALYELHEKLSDEPAHMGFAPLSLLTHEAMEAFERPPDTNVWPEIGSRAMDRIVRGEAGWLQVQAGRYRYLTVVSGYATVRLVIGEYLACEIIWNG